MYGIKGINLAWFRSYLTNRIQYISITHNLETYTKNICCGVPQSLILRPLLFLLYVNDLCSSSVLDPIMFADDTNLFYTIRTEKLCSLQLIKNCKKLMIGLRQINSLLTLEKQNSPFSINQVEKMIFLSITQVADQKAESGKGKINKVSWCLAR